MTYGVFLTGAELTLATAFVVGITALVKRYIAEDKHDTHVPPVAVVLALVSTISLQISHGTGVTVSGIMVGVVFGLTVSGVYAAAKEIKKAESY